MDKNGSCERFLHVCRLNPYQSYLEAVRDYWLARVELARTVGRRLPSDAGIGERTPSLGDILGPAEAPAMDHSQHGGMDHSQHEGMDHSQHEGMDHSQHEGMDHSQHEGMDHSQHGGTDHSKHEAMDHSGHEGMDHSSHGGANEHAPEEATDEHDHHHHGAQP